ncbi:hypothetical protein TanjilG_30488 [Lupinus angustifolius]|nr:hypothetical protein TanjilG_30488 [Lupinus angustifolius]
MHSVTKSLKSYNKHSRKFSLTRNTDSSSSDHENLPILLHQDNNHSNPSSAVCDNAQHESFDFRRKVQPPLPEEDPPSRLIGKFLHKQRASGDFSLDMDLEMEELQEHYAGDGKMTPVEESPTMNHYRISRDVKVSFEEPAPVVVEVANDDVVGSKNSKDSPSIGEFQRPPQPDRRGGAPYHSGDGEVLRCTSNGSLERNLSMQRKSSLLKAKTRSRLLDPPEEPDKRSGRVPRSSQMFSGYMGKKGGDDEEDDPFLEDDFPDEYKKTHFSFWIFLEWLSLILIIGLLITTLSVPLLSNKKLWQLKLWKWEVMVLVLICGRLVSDWMIRIAVFFIERNFLLRKRVLYFVYGVKKPVQNCVWLGLVLIAWHFLFDKRVQRETTSSFLEYVTRILVCLLVGTLVWLVKTLAVKVLASSFHVSTYFDRIQESLFNQFVIETLSGPPLVELQKAEEEEQKLAEEVQKLQNGGATIPPDLRAATAFSTIKSGKLRSGVLQKSPMTSRPLSKKLDDGKGGITIDHLHKLNPNNVSAWNMKRLINMVRHGALTTLDEQILGSANEDENATQIRSENEAKAAAKKIFQNVARHGCRYIRVDDLMHFMREDEAEKTLSMFEGASDSGKISKSALKNWVMVVEEMNILTTIFLRYDNQKILIPNSVLATKAISNFYRSPDMGDAIEFCIHISTPIESISAVKHRIQSYIDNKKEHWYASPLIVFKDCEQLNMIRLAIWPTHKMNFQDMGERFARRSLLIEEMIKIFQELDLQYRLLPHDISIRSMPTTSDRLPPSWATIKN